MSNEIIHLASGKTVLAEVNGLTMDGQRGYILLAVDRGNLYRSLRERTEIEVEKRPDGSWWEVRPLSNAEREAKRYNREIDERNRIVAENRDKPWLPVQSGK